MIGTNSEVPSEPMEPVKFIEDMSEAELATAVNLIYLFSNKFN